MHNSKKVYNKLTTNSIKTMLRKYYKAHKPIWQLFEGNKKVKTFSC